MTSNQTRQDMEMLLSMEIKIRLLDTEGLQIPADPPPLPAQPDNYNFAYMNLQLWQRRPMVFLHRAVCPSRDSEPFGLVLLIAPHAKPERLEEILGGG